jgi:hypothetical protein
MTNSYKIFIGRPEGKRLLGEPKHRWEDNIEMDPKETGMMWTGFIWLRIGTCGGLL